MTVATWLRRHLGLTSFSRKNSIPLLAWVRRTAAKRQARTFELGVAPGYSGGKASIAVPVKLGFSLSNYYELAGSDNKFGFFSVAGIVTVPLGPTTNFGGWNVHFGGEFQWLGDTTTAFNGNHSTQGIASFGLGFSY